MRPTSLLPVITVSAPYGAGGSVVGPRVAEELGVPFLDRAIPTAVAERLSVPLQQALRDDEAPPAALERLLHSFASLAPMIAGAPLPPHPEESVAKATEKVIRQRVEHEGGVVLGRAGAVVLHDHAQALHVRLTGTPERRLAQAMRIDGLDRAAAEERQRETDRARDAYVQYFYGANPGDPAHYHLILDATVIPVDGCVASIVAAARALATGTADTPVPDGDDLRTLRRRRPRGGHP